MVALLGAALFAEGLMRITVEPEMLFETWYSDGVNMRDEELGLRFTPNYSGWMRHPDKVPGVPLQLDENGFRLPNRNQREGPLRQVTTIGGTSMLFSYGLPDNQTVTGRLAHHARHHVEVHNTAWPGFYPFQNWRAYLRLLAPRQPHLDVAVISIYGDWLLKLVAKTPDDFAQPATPPPADKLFRFFDGLARPARFQWEDAMGRSYYRSFILFRFLNRLDTPLSADGVQEKLEPTPENVALAQRRWRAFLLFVEAQLKPKGAKLLVTFLPGVTQKDHYDPLWNAVPPHLTKVNLHQEYHGLYKHAQGVARGHYGPEQADWIGQRLAREVDALMP